MESACLSCFAFGPTDNRASKWYAVQLRAIVDSKFPPDVFAVDPTYSVPAYVRVGDAHVSDPNIIVG